MEEQITINQVKEFSKIYNEEKKNKEIEKKITTNGLEKACINKSIIEENEPTFNIELPESKRYDQKDSLKCWIFAGLNLCQIL